MIAIDTNVLLRFFQHDSDPEQSALAQALVMKHAPVFLNDIVIVEFVWTCRRLFKLERKAVHARLEAIAESTEFVVGDPALFEAALEGYGKMKSDFADWLIGASNLQHGCQATYTFDNGAVKCGGFKLVG
jgi:predicted nucleic-acid-binding protein